MRSRAGIDRLIRMWLMLRGVLDQAAGEPWRANHRERANHLMGFGDDEASNLPHRRPGAGDFWATSRGYATAGAGGMPTSENVAPETRLLT